MKKCIKLIFLFFLTIANFSILLSSLSGVISNIRQLITYGFGIGYLWVNLFIMCLYIANSLLVISLCTYLIVKTFMPYPKYTYEQYKEQKQIKQEQKKQKRLEKLKQKLNEIEKTE